MSRHTAPKSPRKLWIAGMALLVMVIAGTYATSTPAPHSGSPSATSLEEAAAKHKPHKTPHGHGHGPHAPGTTPSPAPEPAPQPTPDPAPEPDPQPAPDPGEEPVPTVPPTQPSPPTGGDEPASPPAGNVPAGGNFPLLKPGSALPSSEECAARVQRDPWEPKPENAKANATRPSGSAPYGMGSWFNDVADGPAYRGRIDGNFTGTTDEIIQWASCKWGFPTDLDRAEAVSETTWQQSFVGDGGESFGLYQMRRGVWAGYPNSANSTAFNADWAMGLRRACYDGVMWYSELKGNLDACVGVHFSGDPDESTWRDYVDSVREHERTKPWLEWDSAAGTPPTATRKN